MNELTVYHFMSDKLNLYSDIGKYYCTQTKSKETWYSIKCSRS